MEYGRTVRLVNLDTGGLDVPGQGLRRFIVKAPSSDPAVAEAKKGGGPWKFYEPAAHGPDSFWALNPAGRCVRIAMDVEGAGEILKRALDPRNGEWALPSAEQIKEAEASEVERIEADKLKMEAEREARAEQVRLRRALAGRLPEAS